LAPYRLAVADFLRNRMPEILNTPAAEAHFYVHEGCMLCEYVEECRTRANAAFDLSRIPYISSESKRHLLAAGFRSHLDLAALDATADQQRIEQLLPYALRLQLGALQPDRLRAHSRRLEQHFLHLPVPWRRADPHAGRDSR